MTKTIPLVYMEFAFGRRNNASRFGYTFNGTLEFGGFTEGKGGNSGPLDLSKNLANKL